MERIFDMTISWYEEIDDGGFRLRTERANFYGQTEEHVNERVHRVYAEMGGTTDCLPKVIEELRVQ